MRTFLFEISVFSGLLLAVESSRAQTWTPTRAPLTNYNSVATSADGRVLVASTAVNIWTSLDSGNTWSLTGASNSATFYWKAVACSADGAVLMALSVNTTELGPIYVSTNAGITWTSNRVVGASGGEWNSPMCLADGSVLAALAQNALCISTNLGANWNTNMPPLSGSSFPLVAAAGSADGRTFVVCRRVGICISTNSGSSWTVTNSLGGVTMMAATADASRLVAVQPGQAIYISTNTGLTWTQAIAPSTNWLSVASSADGATLVAAGGSMYLQAPPVGPIYTSTDYGLTWVSNNVPTQGWPSVTCSADGTRLFAAGAKFSSGAGIWTLETTPAPQLNVSASDTDLTFAWIIPSTNFVLQENSDLTTTNWLTLSNTPTLNLSNLNDEVMLSPSNNNGFFRLMAQ